MSEAKFTKGEWIADIRGGCCAVYEKSRTDDTNGCHSTDDRNIYYSNLHAKYNSNHWEMSLEAKANAHLISAAPEMYEILIQLQIGGGLGIARHRQIEKILAKARGEQ